MSKTLELIQKMLGWLTAIVSAILGMLMVFYGEPIRGLGFLLVAIALFPLFELPMIVRALAAIIGLVFL
jgi:hypothetical protein